MEEILDVEEVSNNDIKDERVKEYLKEDETVEKQLSDKISELTEEKNKLSSKQEELSNLEDSLRSKLNHDSDTNEIRKIADNIDNLKNEMSSISENIKKLESELDEIVSAKEKANKTREDYIKKVSDTINSYEKKISLIKAAIEVCENKHLKEAQEEELSKMQSELDEMKSKRSEELKETVSGAINIESDNKLDSEKITEPINEEVTTHNEQKVEPEFNTLNLDKIDLNIPEESIVEPFNVGSETKEEESKPVIENETKIELEDMKPSVDFTNLQDIVSKVSEPVVLKTKVTDIQDVTPVMISEIFSSGGIMPVVYEKLDVLSGNQIDEEKVGYIK